MIYAAEEVRARFARRGLSFDPTVEEIVRGILEAVREEGDEALDRFSRDLDGYPVEEVPKRAWREAYEDLDEDLRDALETARERIEAFYREEARGGFLRAEGAGCWPSSSAPWSGWGSTSPGEAPLLSTLLMTVVPAKVAGVREVIVASPPRSTPGSWPPPGWRGPTASSPWAGPRPSPPWPTARGASPGWTRSWGRGTATWWRRRGSSTAPWALTASPAPRRP